MVTKRQLGIGFMVIGALVVVGSFVFDCLRSVNVQGFTPELGPMQVAAIIGGGLMFLAGLTLLPLGDRPA